MFFVGCIRERLRSHTPYNETTIAIRFPSESSPLERSFTALIQNTCLRHSLQEFPIQKSFAKLEKNSLSRCFFVDLSAGDFVIYTNPSALTIYHNGDGQQPWQQSLSSKERKTVNSIST